MEGTLRGFGTVLEETQRAGRGPAGALSAVNRDSDFQSAGQWEALGRQRAGEGHKTSVLSIGLNTYNVRGFRNTCQVNEFREWTDLRVTTQVQSFIFLLTLESSPEVGLGQRAETGLR